MKHFYHIICHTDLVKCSCALRRIPCAYTGCVEKLTNPWLPNLDKTLQPHYSIKPETCKYSSILCDYIKWYIFKFIYFKETTNSDKVEIKDELVLNGMTWEAVGDI